MALFEAQITYIEGGRTCSGFFTVEDMVRIKYSLRKSKCLIFHDFFQTFDTRFYRVHPSGPSIHLEPVAVSSGSLDPGYVFILDTGMTIHLWNGKKAKNTLKSKARLMCEKINKNERKNKAEISSEAMGSESKEFWMVLGHQNGERPAEPPKVSNL